MIPDEYSPADREKIRQIRSALPPIEPSNPDATILMGGASSRFPGNKLLADVHGHPPSWHTARSLRECGYNNIYALVGKPESQYFQETLDFVESELKQYSVTPVLDKKKFWASWNKARGVSADAHAEAMRRLFLDRGVPFPSSPVKNLEETASLDYMLRTQPFMDFYVGDALYERAALQITQALSVEDQIHDFSTEMLPEYFDHSVGYSRRPMLHVMKTNRRSKRTIPTSSDPILVRTDSVRGSIGYANWLHKPKKSKNRAIGISRFDPLWSRYDYEMMIDGRYMDSIENFHMLIKDYHESMRSTDAILEQPHHVTHPKSYIVVKSNARFTGINEKRDLTEINARSIDELIGKPLPNEELAALRRRSSWFKRNNGIVLRNMAAEIQNALNGDSA